jgi:hypothetical protein
MAGVGAGLKPAAIITMFENNHGILDDIDDA